MGGPSDVASSKVATRSGKRCRGGGVLNLATTPPHRLCRAMVRAPDADALGEGSNQESDSDPRASYGQSDVVVANYLKLGFGGAHTDSNQRLM
jgi:hypothetical protein